MSSVRTIPDCSRAEAEPRDALEDIARRRADAFLKTCWSILSPELQYQAPSARRNARGWVLYSVADGEKVLVSSANFSTRDRDNRSPEVDDYHFGQSLLAAWAAIGDKLAELPSVLDEQ